MATTYATFNPADKGSNIVLSNGNLTATTASSFQSVRSNVSKTKGKWYWEVTLNHIDGFAGGIGLFGANLNDFVGDDASGWGYYENGNKFHTGSSVAYGSSYVAGDVIGVALDMDGGTVAFYKNGVAQGTAYTGLSGRMYAMNSINANGGNAVVTANFGATAFSFSVPSGFNAGLFSTDTDIEFDSGSKFDWATSSTPTWNHTFSSLSNRIFWIYGLAQLSSDAVVSITVGGVAMTRVQANIPEFSGLNSTYMYVLVNPPTGTQSIVVTLGSSINSAWAASSYTGANQTGQPDNSAKNGGSNSTNLTISLTTIADDCWLVGGVTDIDSTPTAGANTLIRAMAATVPALISDSNGPNSPAGSYSLQWLTGGATRNEGPIIASMSPATIAPLSISVSDTTVVTDTVVSISIFTIQHLSVSDTTVVSDSPNLILSNAPKVSDTTVVSDTPKIEIVNEINVSDTTVVSDTPHMSSVLEVKVSDTTTVSDRVVAVIEETFISSDILATVMVSDYKWLTPTLKQAQLGPGYSPYFKCQIVDDTLTPNAILTSPNVPVFGKAVNAPDGTILMAGGDGSGNLRFWKITDASATFPTGTILATDSGGANYRSELNTTISVSDWINGTYVIDVYFFANSGATTQVMHLRSFDGGLTFSSPYAVNDTGILVTSNQAMGVAAGKPIYNPSTGFVSALFFYLKESGANGFDQIWYQQIRGGSTFEADTPWNNTADSQDWTLHSLDVVWDGQYNHIVFSGHHNWYDQLVNNNFSLYSVRADRLESTHDFDCWQIVEQVIVASSSTQLNLNNFFYPQLSYDGDFFYLTYIAQITTGLTTSNTGVFQAGPIVNQFSFLSKSRDMENFTYPAIILSPDGSEYYEDTATFSLVPQTSGDFYYLLGNGQNWQYVLNDTVADITNDVIGYQIQEMAGQSFQISITLGNANNKWIGPSPTQSGASAIAVNKKIFLEQGYKTSAGNEIAPRNVFYIDTIQLQVSASTNDAVITGRDSSRELQILTSKYLFTRDGPITYVDFFDGSTLSNWTQVNLGWEMGSLLGSNGYALNPTLVTGAGNEAIISYPEADNNSESSTMFIMALMPTTAGTDDQFITIYPIYGSPTANGENFFRLRIYQKHSTGQLHAVFEGEVDGTQFHNTDTVIDSGVLNGYLPIVIRKYNYHTYDALIGSWVSSPAGQYTPTIFDVTAFPNVIPLFSGFSIAQFFTDTAFLVNGNPALGTSSGGEISVFQFFKFLKAGSSLSLQEATEFLGTLSGITEFNPFYSYQDADYFQSDYENFSGSYTVVDDYMLLAPSSLILNTANPIANGEMEFTGKVNPAFGWSGAFGLEFAFRSSANVSQYYFRIEATADQIVASLYAIFNKAGTPDGPHLLSSSSLDLYGIGSNTINVDITQYHNYRVTFVDQIFYLFIDDKMVLMWQDTNIVNSSLNWLGSGVTGNWGLQSDSHSVVQAGKFKSLNMYLQVPNITLNPGDDISSTLNQTLQTAFGWSYTDLMGRFTVRNLNGVDPTTYTYQNLMYNLQADTANQQVINEVTVTGQGVIATVQNPLLIAQMGGVRTANVTDYTITTYEDAVARANQELFNQNRFNNQNTPNTPMNVGAEIFDVIEIINTGGNSTNVDGDFRVYNETFENGGSAGNYSLEIETGTIL